MLKGRFAGEPILVQILILLLLLLLGMFFFTGFALALTSLLYGISPEEAFSAIEGFHQGGNREVFKLVQGLVSIGTFLFPAILGAYLFSRQPSQLLGTQRFPQASALIIICIALMAYSMGALSDLLFRLSSAIPWPEEVILSFEESQEMMLGTYEHILQMDGPIDFLQVLFVMALIPAVAEEGLFRGLIQPLLARYINPHLAILLTSLGFALLHNQYLAFLSIFALGAVLGYLRQWTNSIWPSTLLHFLNNASIVVLVYFMDYDYREALENQSGVNWTETLVLLAIFLVSLFFFRHLSLKQKVD